MGTAMRPVFCIRATIKPNQSKIYKKSETLQTIYSKSQPNIQTANVGVPQHELKVLKALNISVFRASFTDPIFETCQVFFHISKEWKDKKKMTWDKKNFLGRHLHNIICFEITVK